MKIGINGMFLKHPYTGIGQYTLQLLREFSRDTSRDIQFLVVVPNQACLELLRREKIDLPTELVQEKTWMTKGVAKHWWEQIQVPRALRKQSVDLIWLPYPSLQWFGGGNMPTVVTVHDTIPWTREEYQLGVLSWLAHVMSRRCIAKADHIITVSKTSAKDISAVCNVAEKDLTVIENGVAEVFHRPVSPEHIDAVLRRFSLRAREFFLYVGGYDPRKRTDVLIQSYRKYCEMYAKREGRPCPYPLVLTASQHLTDAEKSRSVGIVTTGFLDDLDLAALYQSAAGFVHLSAAEGFNIPLAQAMVSHLPLLLSDTEIHREIAGGAATYVNPDDEVATIAGWEKLACSMAVSRDVDMREKNSERFSWRRSAITHLNTFLDTFTHQNI